MRRARVLAAAAILMLTVGAAPAAAAGPQTATPLATVTGPLAATAASHPFNGVVYDKTVRVLRRNHYVEEEYLVGGSANIYDWPAGSSPIAIAAGPYVTRIVVRRPTRQKDFSGNVVVEMLNPTSLHDLDIVWAAGQAGFIRNGDVWVGLTVKPSSIADLKVYDPVRYATLSMANPVAPRCSTPTWSGATPTTENGLAWDMVSQVGALLKSHAKDNPLRQFHTRAVYLTGFSQTGGYEVTYINAFGGRAVARDGSRVFDGYLAMTGGGFATPINDCAPAPARGSDRYVIQTPGSAPVIAIQTLSDFYALGGFYARRPDSTGAGGNYRLYEVAGAGHIWSTQVAYTPNGAELVRAGFPANWWDPYCDGELTTFPLEYAIDGAFANLYRWVRHGVPAPIADRIAVTDPSSPAARPLTDATGNVIGGLRTPAVDVPVATYFGTTPGTGTCRFLWGSQVPLSTTQLDALYPTHGDYVHHVHQATKAALEGRWITKADAEAIQTAASRSEVGRTH